MPEGQPWLASRCPCSHTRGMHPLPRGRVHLCCSAASKGEEALGSRLASYHPLWPPRSRSSSCASSSSPKGACGLQPYDMKLQPYDERVPPYVPAASVTLRPHPMCYPARWGITRDELSRCDSVRISACIAAMFISMAVQVRILAVGKKVHSTSSPSLCAACLSAVLF